MMFVFIMSLDHSFLIAPMKPISTTIDAVLKRRFFIAPTASIYNGLSGLFDYGPLGVNLKSNIIKLWKKHFGRNNIFEIDCCIITPYEVLKASGHVDKFADLLVYDLVTGDCYRADHLLDSELSKYLPNPEVSSILARVDSLSPEEINAVLLKYDIKSVSGNRIGECTPFNLIFKTNVGAKARSQAFLRPETAQGQFVNFKKLYEMNGERLPFGSFTIGKVFRNEISPRGGLIRVREFEQAEIEFYVHPNEKDTPDFHNLPDMELNIRYKIKEEQETVKMTLKDAVHQNIIDNETIGHFIGLTYLFLLDCGIKPELIRFRQHKSDEMAHYASDCWDGEILTSYGWIECVGIADRGCYDLSMHQKASGTNMTARRNLEVPIVQEKWTLLPDKKILGKELKNELPEFLEILENMTQEFIEKNFVSEGNENFIYVPFNKEEYRVSIKKAKTKVFVEEFIPTVIEPSFGIGRIMYALIESCFYQRDSDSNRFVLGFNLEVAPVKCIVSTLLNKDQDCKSIADGILKELHEKGIESRFCDRNISIGRKYATYDEMGVPFFITIDKESISDGSVTIRERDSMNQIRVLIGDVCRILCEFIRNEKKFDFYFK